MADKITQDDIDNAQAIETILSNTARTRQDLLDLILKQIDGQKKLSEILDKELGKQAQFLTNAEIESRLKEDRIAILEKELSIALEIEQLEKNKADEQTKQADLLQKEQDLLAEIASLRTQNAAAGSAEYRELQRKEQKLEDVLDAQQQQARQLLEINDKIRDNNALVTESSKDIRLKIKAQGEEKKNLDQISAKQKDIRGIIGNQIEQTLGLKDATDSMGDALIDAVFKAREEQGDFVNNFKEEIKQIYEAIGLELNERISGKNVIKNLKARATDFTNDFTARMKQISRQFLDMPILFEKQTGLSQKFGVELKNLSSELNQSGFLLEETEAAFSGLADGLNRFTLIGPEARKELATDAALMNRLGVDTHTFATSIENLTTGMGMTEKAASNFSKEMVAFGKTIGMSGNKVLQDLNANFDILATHGRKKGAEVFKELAKTAKTAGIEMNSLIQIGQKFDTFDGAMKSAGKLNFILGGPLVNSMEMLNATEERRIELLRESLKTSGKSFEDLGRRGKEALASTLGVSVAIAERLFNDENIKSIEDANKALDGSTMSLEELEKQGYKNLTQEQRRELARQKQITTNDQLLKTFGMLDEMITDLQETFGPFLGVLGAVAIGINAISSALSIATSAVALFGAEGAFAGAITTAAWSPITLTVLGIAAAIGVLIGLFHLLGVSGEDVAAGLVAAFEFLGDAIKFIFKNAVRISLYSIEALAHAIIYGLTGGLATLFAGVAEILEYIPGMGDIASAMQAFSPHHMVRGVFSRAQTMVDSFQVGTDYAPGGMSLVGEAGPELVSLPQGAGVTPAEESRQMISTLQTFNNIMSNTAATENINNVVNNANNVNTNTTTGAAAGPSTIKLNLVLKMDEREIGRVAQDVAMDVMQRSLEVSV